MEDLGGDVVVYGPTTLAVNFNFYGKALTKNKWQLSNSQKFDILLL